MDIKITSDARGVLDGLDHGSRTKVLKAMRSIPDSLADDRIVRLSGVEGEIRVRRLSDRLRALYRVTDVDHDGIDEVVVLQILDTHAAMPIAGAQPAFTAGAPEPIRLGRELASEVLTDEGG